MLIPENTLKKIKPLSVSLKIKEMLYFVWLDQYYGRNKVLGGSFEKNLGISWTFLSGYFWKDLEIGFSFVPVLVHEYHTTKCFDFRIHEKL